MIKVRLVGPAKVGTRWLKAGDHEVTAEEKAALDAEGLIEGYVTELSAAPGVDLRQVDLTTLPPGQTLVTFTEEQFRQAVAEEARKVAGEAFDGELGRLEAEVKGILVKAEAEASELQKRLVESETSRASLDELVASLRQANDDLNAQLNARADNPALDAPGEKAPETVGADTAQPQSGSTPADQNTPPSEKAAKTAPKKGAAATTKG